MKKALPLILILPALLCLAPAPPPAAASPSGGTAREKIADSPGCAVTLLKNRDYFNALCGKIREARRQIVLAFFLFRTEDTRRAIRKSFWPN